MENIDEGVPLSWDDESEETSTYFEKSAKLYASLKRTVTPPPTSTTPNNVDKTTISYQPQEDEEEPLILINFTKFTDGKIYWDKDNNCIYNKELYEALIDAIERTEETFATITGNMWHRDMAFHTTSRTWKSDIKTLEQLYPGDYISSISYPMCLGGYVVQEMWKKIRERTESKSINILKCFYLAKSNHDIVYKHNMALSLEFMALEQKMLGSTAKLLLQEELDEDNQRMKEYEKRMQKKYEKQINKDIIKKLQLSIQQLEGVDLNFQDTQEDDNDEENQDGDEDEYYDDNDEDEYNNEENQDNIEEEEEEEDLQDDNLDEDQSYQDSSYIDEADNEDDQEMNNMDDGIITYSNEQEDKENIKLMEEEEELEFRRQQFIEKQEQLKKEEELKKKNKVEEEDEKPPVPSLNVLDKVIAMIFSRLTITDGDKQSHYQGLERMSRSIKENWIEEYGCLPPQCIFREDI